jgi:thiamine-phosphate pyrophosphorylase
MPKRDFTPAAERVLAEASRWAFPASAAELSAPSLLMGLLAESECRAALMLSEHGILPSAVCQRWPELTRIDTASSISPLSPEVEASLTIAARRLRDFSRPLMLATEHLLLGLASAEHDTGVWLRQQGLDPKKILAELHQQHGRSADVLEYFDEPDPPSQAPEYVGLSCSTEAQSQAGKPDVQIGQPAIAASSPLLRVLDAAANRAREGLRVVEDYVRFVLDDRHLTERLKTLRHELTALLSRIPTASRMASRETQSDVGTALTTAAETLRPATSDVLAANFARVQEALRSLEEFGKVLDASMAAGIKQLRYRSYTLQRAVEITGTSLDRLAHARLYVLIDAGPTAADFASLVRTLIDSGVDVLQLRDKTVDDRRLLDRARLLRDLTAGTRTLFIMNDRPDLAALSHADGVHVGQEELTVKDARTILGPDALIGVSTHNLDQARQAVLDGANYLGVGPTFPSSTKRFDAFPGLDFVRSVAAEIRLPSFAIGGIDRTNLPQVLAAGIHRVAVSSAILNAPDPTTAAREFAAHFRL